MASATLPGYKQKPAIGSLQPLARPSFYDLRAVQRPKEMRRYYHQLLHGYYRLIVPAGKGVLELGCGLGDLLAAVEPDSGVGVDSSPVMIKLAKQRHPNLDFNVAEAETYISDEPFNYILLSDLVNEIYDIQAFLAHLHTLSHPDTRLVINFFNHLWHPILTLAERLGAKSPLPPQNWLSTHDMANLLNLAGWELIKTDARILWPLRTPLWASFCNRWLAPLLRHFCLTTIMIAREDTARRSGVGGQKTEIGDQRSEASAIPHSAPRSPHLDCSCSVAVPARDEAGSIQELVARLPDMGLGTEIIFVEGGSTDRTWEEIQLAARLNPHRDIKILKQSGRGKGQAVRQGFAAATGDLLFILDADLSVPPEELVKFYEVARSGIGEFINGVRTVYPMEHGAMRFCNMVANKFFSLAFGFLLGQPIKDTLCGTKALFRRDYEAIAGNRSYLGDSDPFGDFDLLFGAARLNLRIVDLPVHYQARTYGQTNIARWRHGWLLLKMAWLAARRMKFAPVPSAPRTRCANGLCGTAGLD